MNSRIFFFAVCLAVVIGGGLAQGDVLLAQPVDFVNRWGSFLTPSGVVLSDDYWIDEPVVVESVTFFMVATFPNVPWEWSFSVHRGYYDHPAYDFAPFVEHFFRMFGPSSVTDLGPWPGEENLHLFEVRFDNVGLLLEPYLLDERAFWFSCAGHLLDYPTDRCFMATAGDGEINRHMGYQKFVPHDFPGWRRLPDAGLPASDFAMRIEGVPADEYQPTTELLDYEVVNGWYVDGGVDDMGEVSDGRALTLESRAAGPPRHHRATVTARLRTLVANPDMLDVAVTADLQRTFPIGEAEVWLRNWSTGDFESRGEYDIHKEMATWAFSNIDASNYINEDGIIELRFEVRLMVATRLSYRFETNIDRIRINALHEE